jgi:hypothetical protein
MNCPTCGQEVKVLPLATRVRRVNDMLFSCGKTYYDTLGDAHHAVWASLHVNDFDATSFTNGQLLDRGKGDWFQSTRVHLGETSKGDKYVTANFHRMPSGRYEVVAYVG